MNNRTDGTQGQQAHGQQLTNMGLLSRSGDSAGVHPGSAPPFPLTRGLPWQSPWIADKAPIRANVLTPGERVSALVSCCQDTSALTSLAKPHVVFTDRQTPWNFGTSCVEPLSFHTGVWK